MNPKKLILVSALLTIILITVYYVKSSTLRLSQEDTKPTKQSTSELKSHSHLLIDNTPLKNQPSQHEKSNFDILYEGKPLTNWLAEISNPVYSNDPVVEASSLRNDFRKCTFNFRALNNKTNNEPKLTALKEQIKTECHSYAAKYPLWFNARDRDKIIMNLPSTSIAGERLQYILGGYYGQHNDLDYDHLIQARIEVGLTIKSPGMTSFGALDNGIGLIAPLEQTALHKELLQTQVGMWIFQANQFALQALSCEFPNSRSCEPTSFFMLTQCDRDELACGLNFHQWFENFSSSGMKKDVEILMQYYRDNF